MWTKSIQNSYLENNSIGNAFFYCPVNFIDGTYYVKSMSVDLLDTSSSGYIRIKLMRRHFPTGTVQAVAEYVGSLTGTPGQTKVYVGSNPGTKFIDTTYFTYWIEVYFNEGNSSLQLYAVRINYGE
jgi:hypothetical protein